MRQTSLQLLLVTAFCITSPLHAEDILWDGSAGDLDWFNPQNWSSNVLPSSSDSVTLGLGGVISSSNPFALGEVSSLNNLGSISGTRVSISGTSFVNAGTFQFTDYQSIGFDGLRINSSVALSGGGEIVLAPTPGQFVGAFGGPRIAGTGELTNLDNTIRGVGTITTSIVNYGTISAESPNGYGIYLTGAAENHGILQSVNGGVLNLYGTVEGTGQIRASEGFVRIYGDVAQSLIDASQGSILINAGTVEASDWLGTLAQTGGTFSSRDLGIAAISGDYSMANGASLRIDIDPSQKMADRIDVAGAAGLLGNLSLNVSPSVSLGQFDHFRVMNIDGTRTGSFGYSEGASVGHYGGRELFITFEANNGHGIELFTGLNTSAVPVQSATSSQTAYVSGTYGTLGTGNTYTYSSYEVRPGATATLALSDTLVLTDGPLFVAPGGLFIASGIVEGDIINAGTVHVKALYQSSFTNTGDVTFFSPASPPTSPSGAFDNQSTVRFEQGDYAFGAFTNGPGAVMDTAGGTASGGGGNPLGPVIVTIEDGNALENLGSVVVGDLQVRGNYTQLTTGQTIFDLGGTTPIFGYSQLHVTGVATLEGSFVVQYINGFFPNIGDTFDLLIADGGINLLSPGWLGLNQEPGFNYSIVHENGSDIFRATFVAVPELPSLSLIIAALPGLLFMRRMRGQR